jgi:hypothetical protein
MTCVVAPGRRPKKWPARRWKRKKEKMELQVNKAEEGKNKALEDGFYVLIVVGVIIIMGCGRYRKCLKSIYVSIYVSICTCASIRSQSAEATKFECQ